MCVVCTWLFVSVCVCGKHRPAAVLCTLASYRPVEHTHTHTYIHTQDECDLVQTNI